MNCSLNVSNLRRARRMVRSTLRSLARRYRSVLHETSGRSAQSYRPSTCRPVPVPYARALRRNLAGSAGSALCKDLACPTDLKDASCDLRNFSNCPTLELRRPRRRSTRSQKREGRRRWQRPQPKRISQAQHRHTASNRLRRQDSRRRLCERGGGRKALGSPEVSVCRPAFTAGRWFKIQACPRLDPSPAPALSRSREVAPAGSHAGRIE